MRNSIHDILSKSAIFTCINQETQRWLWKYLKNVFIYIFLGKDTRYHDSCEGACCVVGIGLMNK